MAIDLKKMNYFLEDLHSSHEISEEVIQYTYLEDLFFDVNDENEKEVISLIKIYIQKNKTLKKLIFNLLFYIASVRPFAYPTYARIYKEISSFYPKKTPELDEFSYYLYAHDLLRDTMDLTSFNFLIDSDIDELSLKWYDEGNITNSLINDDVDRIIEYSTTNDISKRFIRYKNNNFSLLGLSAFASAVKIFKYLLLNDTRPNIELEVINGAISGGNEEILQILQQKNCNFLHQFKNAISYHRNNIASWLNEENLTQDIDPNFCIMKYNMRAFFYSYNTFPIIRSEILIFAIQNDSYFALKYLIDMKCPLDLCNSGGDTPLLFAVNMGKFPLVKLLVENGASVNVTSDDDYNCVAAILTSFHKEKTKIEILDYLLDHGLKIDYKIDEMYIELLLSNNNINLLKNLLEKAKDATIDGPLTKEEILNYIYNDNISEVIKNFSGHEYLWGNDTA